MTPHSAHRPEDQPRGLLSSATLLARRGRYGEALALIAHLRQSGPFPDAALLDLEGRIYAQQGMLVQAEACWLEAFERDPANPAYIEALAQLRRSANPFRRLGTLLVAAAVVAAVAGALWFAYAGYTNTRRQQEEIAAGFTRLERAFGELRTAQADLSARIERNHGAVRKLDQRMDRSTRDLRRQLAALRKQLDRPAARTE